MDKVSQIADAYRVLLDAGRVRNKKEFAALLGRDYTGVVSAMNGNEKFLTDSLVAASVALAAGTTEAPAPSFRVPLIPVEAHAGSLAEFSEAVSEYDCELVVSPVRGASFAIQVTGESMAPAYPNGARILCQQINEAAFIEWGKVYLLDTVNGAILKQVRKAATDDRVLCCSLNPAPEFSPFEVECRHIRGWYRVLMVMSLV